MDKGSKTKLQLLFEMEELKARLDAAQQHPKRVTKNCRRT